MYQSDVRKVQGERQGYGMKRSKSFHIQRKETPASRFLKAGQPNIFQEARCREKQGRPNRTGLPDTLKAGIEHLSGISMDDVRVHYNSSRPAQLQALAYTKGTDIHIAPGQTRHLPHEAWHVVQQKQGRVMPTMRLGGDLINDNPELEREADCMGAKAVRRKFKDGAASVKQAVSTCVQRKMPEASAFLDKYYVKVYKDFIKRFSTITRKTPLPAGNKIEALKQISEEAAGIGNKVRESEMDESEFFYAEISAKYNTERQLKIQALDSQINELVNNTYAESYMKEFYWESWEENKRELKEGHAELKPVTLSLKYQFRKEGVNLTGNEVGGPGYVVSVDKTRQGGRANATGYMVKSRRNRSGRPIWDNTNDSHSNRHEPAQGSILGHTYRRGNVQSQRGDIRSKNFDAYTKLAGEGARFQCVRRNIARIADDTVIHVSGQNQGVRFCDLWKTWSAFFDKKYDIPDDEIAEKLLDTMGGKFINTLATGGTKYTKPVNVKRNNHIELI